MTDYIDFSKVYKIEAIPSRDSKELAEHGLSTFPGITQTISASWNGRLNKYEKTGFDENSIAVLKLAPEKRDEVRKRIVDKREEIEALIGQLGYLKPTSDAWISELCIGEIEVGQDLKIRVNGHDNVLRPSENYKDAIMLSLIMHDDNFPKSKSDISKPEHKHSKFYLTTDEEFVTDTKSKVQKTRRANIEMGKLFDDGKNKQRAWEIAYKLQLVSKEKVASDELEMRMQNAIFNDKSGKTIDAFLEACDLDKETLLIHNLFRQGITIRVIRMSKDGQYSRGVVNYRKTIPESIQYLMTPGNEIELGELRSEVEGRKKKHTSIG